MPEPGRPAIRRREFLAAASGLVAAACSGAAPAPSPRSRAGPTTGRIPMVSPGSVPPAGAPRQRRARPATPATAAVMLARSQIPVLCFHQVRDWAAADSPSARTIITPPRRFAAQIDALAGAGYTPITPDQLLAYLQYGTDLPARPVLLSFDDASAGQYTHALPVLLAHRFTATFFVMTVVLDKPRWLSRTQVRDLHRRGMAIGAHTWDHHPVTGYSGHDWQIQLVQPARELAAITSQPVRLFAYPYGLWNQPVLPHLHAAGYQAAFQLNGAQDRRQPLPSVSRLEGVLGARGGRRGQARVLHRGTTSSDLGRRRPAEAGWPGGPGRL